MSENTIIFRIASIDDASRLQNLIQAAFRAEDSREDWVGSPELATQFTIDIEDINLTIASPDHNFIVAVKQNDIIGCIGVRKRSAGYARIFYLAIDPEYHRGGLGRQILEYGENYCRREFGVGKLGLDALSTRKALILWYERRGYIKTGELKPFPVGKIDGRAVPEDLCFVEMEKDAPSI